MKRRLGRLTGILLLVATLGFVVIPFTSTSWRLLTDRGLRSAAPSEFAYRLHQSLSRRLPGYIDRRIASGKAEGLSVSQITATEWPLYGAFFYLLATDNLQRQWENDRSLARRSPAESGSEAIEASVRIISIRSICGISGRRPDWLPVGGSFRVARSTRPNILILIPGW